MNTSTRISWKRTLLTLAALPVLASFSSCGEDSPSQGSAEAGNPDPQNPGNENSGSTVGGGNSTGNPDSGKSKTKNIILVIGDGMGPQQIAQAVQYRQLHKPDSKPLALETLLNEHSIGLLNTQTLEIATDKLNIVGDSAASATAMATGRIAYEEVLSVDKNGPLETVLERAQDLGKATGLITDTRFDHATPAAFFAHQESRFNGIKIVTQDLLNPINGRDVDIYLAGGWNYFLKDNEKVSQFFPNIHPKVDGSGKRSKDDALETGAIFEQFKNRGYNLVATASDLKAIPETQGTKILGGFAADGFPYPQESAPMPEQIPTMKAMAEKTLNILSQNDRGFFLMAECGQIDWAAHANDAGTLLKETLECDEMIQHILDWSKDRDDTLVIVTADHETGSGGFSYTKFVDQDENDAKVNKDFGGKPLPLENDFAVADLAFTRLENQNVSFPALVVPLTKKLYPNPLPPMDPNDPNEPPVLPPPEITLDEAANTLVQNLETHTDYTIDVDTAKKILFRANPNPKQQKDARTLEYTLFHMYDVHSNLLGEAVSGQNYYVWGTGSHTSTPVNVFVVGPERYVAPFRGLHHNSLVGQIIFQVLEENL